MKVRFRQDTRDFRALVPLNLDLTVLDGAAGAAGAPHGFGQLLFFRPTDADKIFDHRNRLAATPGLDPKDIHPAAISLRRFRRRHGIHRWVFKDGGQPFGGQAAKGIVPETLAAVGGNAFGNSHVLRTS